MSTAATAARKPATRPAGRPPQRYEDPDVALMLRVQRDEAGAFGEVLQRHWGKVFGRFVRWLGDREEAEDLAQDVFLRLYRARKRYQPRAKFGTWLYHISKNVARNALRARRRHPSIRLSSLGMRGQDDSAERLLVDGAEPPTRPLERSEEARVVRAAVSGLGGRQRTALELYQFKDLSYAEIADEMAMSPKAAKSLLYRARNQLRADLNRYMDPR